MSKVFRAPQYVFLGHKLALRPQKRPEFAKNWPTSYKKSLFAPTKDPTAVYINYQPLCFH